METNLETKNRPHNEDLATYLDKLLRQDYRHPPQAPSRPSWEHTRDVPRPSRSEVLSPPEIIESQETETLTPGPAEAEPVRDKTKKRRKRTPRPRQTKVRRKRAAKPRNLRQVVMATLIPVLAVTLLLLVRNPGVSPASMTTTTGLDMNKTLPQTDPEIKILWEVPAPYVAAGRDPMALMAPPVIGPEPSVPQVAPRTKLVVKGILYSEDRPAVIIGTDLLHPGDEVSGAKIVKIDRDSVEFEADGRTWKQQVAPADETLDGKTK